MVPMLSFKFLLNLLEYVMIGCVSKSRQERSFTLAIGIIGFTIHILLRKTGTFLKFSTIKLQPSKSLI